MKTYYLALCMVLGCSQFNREGPDLSCSDLKNGARNACGDGIITSCVDGAVKYEVCVDENVCDEGWQVEGAYRCHQGDQLPTSSGDYGTSTGTSSGTALTSSTGTTTGTGAGVTNCDGDECVVATFADKAQDLVADETTLYVSDCGSVFSVPLAGGGTTLLHAFESRRSIWEDCPEVRLAIGDGTLYAAWDTDVYEVADASEPTIVASLDYPASALAVSGADIVAIEGTNVRLYSGGGGTTIGSTYATGLAIGGRTAYWIQTGLVAYELNGGTTTSYPLPGDASSDSVESIGLSADAAFVPTWKGLAEVPLSGSGGSLRSDVVVGYSLGHVAVGENAVYWGTADGVMSVPLASGTASAFSNSSADVDSKLIVSGGYVYWVSYRVDTQDYALMRRPEL